MNAKHIITIASALTLCACGAVTAPPSTSVPSASREQAIAKSVENITRRVCHFEPTFFTIADVALKIAAKYKPEVAVGLPIATVAQSVADEVCAPILARAYVPGRGFVTRDGVRLHGRFVRSGHTI